jgi:hypothetical protein
VNAQTAFQVRPIFIASWHAGQVAYILDKLDAVQALWGNELGVGNNHTYQNIPWVLVGAGGYFKTGRYLQYKDQPHNNLLVSVCNAVGLTA